MQVYGNLTNRILETTVGQPEPVVGMGCTICHYSDRSVYTIIEVATDGKSFRMQEDNHKAIGEWAVGGYEYSPNKKGVILEVKICNRGKNKGKWHNPHLDFNPKTGDWTRKTYGNTVLLGRRDYHYDFSF